jgi:hypothetical protein
VAQRLPRRAKWSLRASALLGRGAEGSGLVVAVRGRHLSRPAKRRCQPQAATPWPRATHGWRMAGRRVLRPSCLSNSRPPQRGSHTNRGSRAPVAVGDIERRLPASPRLHCSASRPDGRGPGSSLGNDRTTLLTDRRHLPSSLSRRNATPRRKLLADAARGPVFGLKRATPAWPAKRCCQHLAATPRGTRNPWR